MKLKWHALAGVLLAVSSLALPVSAEDAKPAVGNEVTITGVMMCEISCTRQPVSQEDGNTPVLFAMDGPPAVVAAFQDVTKELYAGHSINFEQAMEIEDGFNKRLKYYVPLAAATLKKLDIRYSNPIVSVTGVVSEKDGKKWISASSAVHTSGFKYPTEWLMPDKPLKKAGEKPLLVTVGDNLEQKCILIPAGKFMMRNPFYVTPRWQDEFPLEVTLTKPFWIAECPVTQEMWDAVMGAENNHSTLKDPKRPVRNMFSTEINKFCQILSEKNGRKVRLPGEAELQYAYRCGTSNPPLWPKFKEMSSDDPKGDKNLTGPPNLNIEPESRPVFSARRVILPPSRARWCSKYMRSNISRASRRGSSSILADRLPGMPWPPPAGTTRRNTSSASISSPRADRARDFTAALSSA